MRKIIKIISIFSFLLLLNFLNLAHASEKIKIGLLVPMTGENKDIGASIIKAVSLAIKDINNQSKWHLLLSNWNATIIFELEDLSVIWESEGQETKRLFSYCINREDVENAILQGP